MSSVLCFAAMKGNTRISGRSRSRKMSNASTGIEKGSQPLIHSRIGSTIPRQVRNTSLIAETNALMIEPCFDSHAAAANTQSTSVLTLERTPTNDRMSHGHDAQRSNVATNLPLLDGKFLCQFSATSAVLGKATTFPRLSRLRIIATRRDLRGSCHRREHLSCGTSVFSIEVISQAHVLACPGAPQTLWVGREFDPS